LDEKARPGINFSTQAAIVVAQGLKSTGGYSVEVTGIKRIGTVLAVTVNERRPASGDVTSQGRTSPYVAVAIPRPPNGVTVRFADAGVAAQVPQQERNTNVRPRARGTVRRRRRH
jgi:hypothetical protein